MNMLKNTESATVVAGKNAAKKSVAKKAVATKKPVTKVSISQATVKKVTAKKSVAKKIAAKPAVKKTAVKKTPAQPSAKAAVKRDARAATKASANSIAKPSAPIEAVAKAKIKKAKLVRDSFTMPESEYRILNDVKKAFLKSGIAVKKSELLRAGVALLNTTSEDKLRILIAGLPPLKAGRPKKDK